MHLLMLLHSPVFWLVVAGLFLMVFGYHVRPTLDTTDGGILQAAIAITLCVIGLGLMVIALIWLIIAWLIS